MDAVHGGAPRAHEQRRPAGVVGDPDLVARMVGVLRWIAEGSRGRFDDYARIAGEMVREVQGSSPPPPASPDARESEPKR